jgi:hypothetical protein
MIHYQHNGLIFDEVYFDEEPLKDECDIVLYYFKSSPGHITRHFYFPTLLIDLTQTPDQLLATMDKATAYEIRRAQNKDGILTHVSTSNSISEDVLKSFVLSYDAFAKRRQLPELDVDKLTRLWKAGLLTLTEAQDAQGNSLVTHAYNMHLPQRQARLLHSVSHHNLVSDSRGRALIGRANRLLHFNDILALKALGITSYDFGGWYSGNSDESRLKINQFKEAFGGRVVCRYYCEESVSLKGTLYLWAREMKILICHPAARRELHRRKIAPLNMLASGPNTAERDITSLPVL